MGTPTLDPQQVVGHKVLDAAGNKIGQAGQVYRDRSAEHEQWILVKSGLLGKGHLAPMSGAHLVADDVQLAYGRAQVDGAPDLDAGRPLSADEELALYRHYGLGSDGGFPTAKLSERDGTGGGVGEYLTRSEERLRLNSENVEVGHAKLHKWITTERVTRTIPVKHEEVRIERDPIVAGSTEADGVVPDWTEQEQDVVLHEERAMVRKETVPVERVRMRVEEVTEDVSFTEDLRTEQIDYQEDEALHAHMARTRQAHRSAQAGEGRLGDPRKP
ncbi:YsnF/AvaK domain-containing protein [Streptacidiphilus carbonis]|uniref:YsnF/AvaK domain-containing protein n=1 Tax=Streptacidiphilus carbonis TaxID=105422 RepID=UPI0006936AD8|nr:YsnF/AvaK domain-containing protein [Streptacidiphilus carbonis]